MFSKLWASHCARSNRYCPVDKSTAIPIGIASERTAYFGSGRRIVFHITCLPSFPAIQEITTNKTSASMTDEDLENQSLWMYAGMRAERIIGIPMVTIASKLDSK